MLVTGSNYAEDWPKSVACAKLAHTIRLMMRSRGRVRCSAQSRKLLCFICGLLLALPHALRAQEQPPASARAFGIAAGTWDVAASQVLDPRGSVYGEVFLQRSLSDELAIQNSLAVWRLITTEPLPFPSLQTVEVKSYVVPLLLSLKLYLFDSAEDRVSPYVTGGAGLAFGIEDEDPAVSDGGGSSVATGLGLRGGAGVEARVLGGVYLTGSARYEWLHFGEKVGSLDTYNGVGLAGGITYRFRF